MTRKRQPVRWLHLLGLGKPSPDESAALEVEHHLAELTDRLIAEGLSVEEARREAERHFGDRARYAAKMRRLEERSLRGDRWTAAAEVVRQSVVSVARMARREPGFMAAVVMTLGLGIGANATMYGIIDRLLLSGPEHVVNPAQVHRVLVLRPGLSGDLRPQPWAYPDFADLRAHSGMRIAGYDTGREYVVGTGEAATRLRGALATAELFPVLGVQPRLGRFYTAEESSIAAPPTVVISEELWRSAYGAAPDILGQTLELEGQRVPIVGVAPAGFTGVELAPVDLWLPLEAMRSLEGTENTCLTGRNCYWMSAVARLSDGSSTEAVEAEATRLHQNGRREEVEQGSYSEAAGVRLAPFIAAEGGSPSPESRVAMWLAGVSLIVLVIACANVTNLLIARGTTRRRETSVRLALGVGRARIVGQTILESVALALLGLVLALTLARWGGAFIRTTLLPDVSFPNAAVSPRGIGFAVMISLMAGLASGVGPAFISSRLDVRGDLADASRGHTGARSVLRGFLTATQAALSVVLLVGAGLFIGSLRELRSLDLGMDTRRLLVVDYEFAGSAPDPLLRQEIYDEAIRRVAPLPGVEAVATTATPFTTSYSVRLRVQGLDSLPRIPGGGPYVNSVSPSYFETAGLTIIRGRTLQENDAPGDPKVAVVSETMARALWPDEEPLGRCFFVAVGSRQEECVTVVGVVEDAARNGFRDGPSAAYYLHMTQVGEGASQGPVASSGPATGLTGVARALGAPNALYIRAEGDPGDIQVAVTRALRPAPPTARWTRVYSMDDTLDRQARSWTLGATMFSIFGLLALVVAAVGLYSVLAFDVAQRTREIGIRTALGARKARLLRWVVAKGVLVGGIGVALGIATAYVAAPYIQDLLFDTSPRDPVVFGTVALVLLAVSVVASLVPALRATRVDPVTALRTD